MQIKAKEKAPQSNSSLGQQETPYIHITSSRLVPLEVVVTIHHMSMSIPMSMLMLMLMLIPINSSLARLIVP